MIKVLQPTGRKFAPNDERPTIVFLVSSLSQPRAIRRIESIFAMGYQVDVYGYDRSQYNCNRIAQSIPVHVLGQHKQGGNYLGKVRQIKKDVKRIVREYKGKKCLYYSFGFIETFFLKMAGVSYVYEISDIAYSGGTMGKLKPILRRIDRGLVRQSAFTLMTSEGFKQYLNIEVGNIIIQPNKVNKKLMGCERKPLMKECNDFIFSFAGSIRYESMLRFARVIGKYFPQHQFHFYGVANVAYTQQVLDELTRKYPNVKTFGAFKNPDDFESIYNSVDVVVTTYGNTSLNERILDPNKLYEAILFCKPLIVTDGTHLADQVQKYGCGIAIDSSSEETIKAAIESLSFEQLNKISQHEHTIPDDFAFDNTDRLAEMIEKATKTLS